MAATPARERTIAFFRITAQLDGATEPFAQQLPHATVLEQMSRVEFEDRRCDVGQDLIGSPTWMEDQWHLLLHKVKPASDWLARADFDQGTIEELETGARQGFLESTVVVFAPFGNIVGIVLGSVGAPSQKSLELWLNKMGAYSHPVSVQPLMSPGEIEKFEQSGAAQNIEVKTTTHLPLTGKTGGLATAMRSLRDEYGDASVTIRISIPRGRPDPGRTDQREKLRKDLDELADVLPRAARARVGLLFSDGDDYGRARLTELVEHHVTAKRNIPAVDEEGTSIKIRAAVLAVLHEIEANEKQLRDCVGE